MIRNVAWTGSGNARAGDQKPRVFSDRRLSTGVSTLMPLQCGTANASISIESDGKQSYVNMSPVKFHTLAMSSGVLPFISEELDCYERVKKSKPEHTEQYNLPRSSHTKHRMAHARIQHIYLF